MLPVPKQIGTLDRSVPAMAESSSVLSGSLPVARKTVHIAFDGGRLTSDAGVLVLAEVERRLGLAERLARCVADAFSMTGSTESRRVPGSLVASRLSSTRS